MTSAEPYTCSVIDDGRSPTSTINLSPADSSSASPDTVISNGSSGPRLRPINTCLTCRSRKIRCDRQHPCSQCVKSERECRYESSSVVGMDQRGVVKHIQPIIKKQPVEKVKKPRDDLKKRLSRLESLLSATIDPTLVGQEQQQQIAELRLLERQNAIKNITNGDGISQHANGASAGDVLPLTESVLEINGAKTKYHGPLHWLSAVDSEIGDLDITPFKSAAPPPGEQADNQFATSGWMSSFLFSPNIMVPNGMEKITSLVPPRHQADHMINVYYERIDPIIRIIHKPTFNNMYLEFWSGTMPTESQSGFLSLFFAMLHGAVVSMDPITAETVLGRDRQWGMNFYKEASQRALSEARFLESEEMITLQALTLLLSLWSSNKTNAQWTIIAVAFRIARNMGLHRDAAQFSGIDTVEVEVRRRLWYYVQHLELYSLGTSSSSSSASEESFDTKLPLNVNDEDLIPGRPLPTERKGMTEMSHFLARISSSKYYQKSLRLTGGGIKKVRKDEFHALFREIQDWGRHLEETQLKPLRDDVAMERFVKLSAILLMNKAMLVLYYPFSNATSKKFLPESVRESATMSACTVIECCNEIESDPMHAAFRWYYSSHIQVHALTIAISELLSNPNSVLADRCWECVSRFFWLAEAPEFQWAKNTKGSESWAILKALHDKATRIRIEMRPAEFQPMEDDKPPRSVLSDVVSENVNPLANGEIDWETWDALFTDGTNLFNEFLVQSPPAIQPTYLPQNINIFQTCNEYSV